MTLRDTTALVIFVDSTDMTPSLPNPATVAGRVHWLANANLSSITVASSGTATPFLESGQAAASIGIQAGQAKFLQADGVNKWKVLASLGSRRIFSGTGTTDGSGNVTFTFTPAFPSVPVAVAQIGPSADAALVEARITALSASSCTLNVRRSPAVVILGLSVLEVPQNAVGAPVQLVAIEAGQGV